MGVWEVCNVKVWDVYVKEKLMKVEGKGRKEGVVGMWGGGIDEVELYFGEGNEGVIKGG